MSVMLRHCIADIISQPNGLFLVSGPTGSGKTTLLYAILNALHNGHRNICTIEHPVEYTVAKITQINVSHHISFSLGLRTVLRQDPDVILIGEIRDSETAKIVVEAANTGHLVLSTIHANTSALAITRMIDFGVNPMSLAGCLRSVTAQRLVRAVGDKDGIRWRPRTPLEEEWLTRHNVDIGADSVMVPHDDGRKEIFSGRLPIIEMIKNDESVSRAIVEGRGEVSILNAAVNQPQLELLGAAGVRLARKGLTTIEEVMEAVGKEAIVPSAKSLGRKLIESGLIRADHLYPLLEQQAKLRQKGFVRTLEEMALLAKKAAESAAAKRAEEALLAGQAGAPTGAQIPEETAPVQRAA
jgi:general secretion pathway protein E